MAVFCLIVAVGFIRVIGEVSADFDLHPGNTGDYEFVYHEFSNLLLTFHGSSCYFTTVDQELHDHLLHGNILNQLENQIRSVVADKDSPQKYRSSLDTVRAQFSDVLADYRCEEDQIFILWLDHLKCDFKRYQSLCGWHDKLQGTLAWRLGNGATPTILTGPDHDHTLGTREGQYLYIDANDAREGAAAEIVSPVLHLADSLCLRFWYSMHGTGIGHLTVYTAHPEDHRHNTTLWHESGNHGNVWRLGEVTVPVPTSPSPTPWRIHLRATRGPDMFGDIAIDDVSSLPGLCDPGLLNCSFEADEGLCLWGRGGPGVVLNWTIHSGPTHTAGTGPDSAPHTAQGENHAYLYLEGDDGQPGQVAELRSSSFFLHTPLCLRFWYHMKGSGIYLLAVLLRRQGSNADTLLWQRLGPQHSTIWTQAQVTLPPDHSLHRLVIRGFRGMSALSDMAVDLVSVSPGPCGTGGSLASVRLTH